MPVEKIRHGCELLGCAEFRSAVGGAGDYLEPAFDSRFLQCRVQHFALLNWDEAIVIAMQDEKGRGTLSHKEDRTRTSGERLTLPNRSTQQLHDGRIRIFPAREHAGAPMNKISRPEPVKNALHRARLIKVFPPVEFTGVGGGAQQSDEMPAGRSAPNADAF